MGRNAFFNFKTFGVQFSKKVFPVGTDSSLLGAWMCKYSAPNLTNIKVLDVGCGTGILSFFAAKTLDASVTAIDIQEAAIEQCLENVALNKLQSTISVLLSDISTFEGSPNSYDVVLSNPPYFPDIREIKTEREMARQMGQHFDLNILLQKAEQVLHAAGKVFLVVPADQTHSYISAALENKLHLAHIAFVKGNQRSEIKRTLLCFSKAEPQYLKEELIVVEEGRNLYTQKAKSLLSPFYLNL
jgi:tRNA1Val (adenine37-N6)-methyltransferase